MTRAQVVALYALASELGVDARLVLSQPHFEADRKQVFEVKPDVTVSAEMGLGRMRHFKLPPAGGRVELGEPPAPVDYSLADEDEAA